MGTPETIITSSGMTDLVRDLRGIISRYFSIEDVRWSDKAIAFYIFIDEERLDENFDELRKELVPRGFVPALAMEHNDYIIYITNKPQLQPRSVAVNITMFILTLISTIWAGAVLWVPRADYQLSSSDYGSYLRDILGTLTNPELVAYGALFFALPLMLILGIHELGHYLMSKKHGVDASLPFFIPIPPFIGPLGTFGAFISMREPMPSKKALIDIGAAGPIAGFIIAIPVTIIGLALTDMYPIEPDLSGDVVTYLGSPLIFTGLKMLIPIADDSMIHPTAFAGWVGILVTAMNLLPAGQLDGGHITRALFGNNSKYISYIVVLVLFLLGFMFAGWMIFAVLILMLGMSHPPPLNDVTNLSPKRKAIGAFAIVMLVVCFVPIPILIEETTLPEFEIEAVDDQIIGGIGDTVNLSVIVKNTGETKDTILVDVTNLHVNNSKQGGHIFVLDRDYYNESMNFTGSAIDSEGNEYNTSSWGIFIDNYTIELGKQDVLEYIINVKIPNDAEYGDLISFNVIFESQESKLIKHEVEFEVLVGKLSLSYDDKSRYLHAKTKTEFNIELKNTGTTTMTVEINATISISSKIISEDWNEPDLTTNEIILSPGQVELLILTIEAPKTAVQSELIIIEITAEDKFDSNIADSATFEVYID